MFFVSEITLPFETMDQVVKAFPSWNLIFMDGWDSAFKIPAMQVRILQKIIFKTLIIFSDHDFRVIQIM